MNPTFAPPWGVVGQVLRRARLARPADRGGSAAGAAVVNTGGVVGSAPLHRRAIHCESVRPSALAAASQAAVSAAVARTPIVLLRCSMSKPVTRMASVLHNVASRCLAPADEDERSPAGADGVVVDDDVVRDPADEIDQIGRAHV